MRGAGPRPAPGPQIPALTEASPQFAETMSGLPEPPPSLTEAVPPSLAEAVPTWLPEVLQPETQCPGSPA